MERKYTTFGSVRGSCGHNHQSLDSAAKCAQRDQRGCTQQGGYSDRSVKAVVNGQVVDLEDSEVEYLWGRELI